MEEIDIVEYYVRKLVDDSIVAAKDIGIITPYRKQVLESMQSNEIT
jgi:superfamily I DNA and/or RNA helicase